MLRSAASGIVVFGGLVACTSTRPGAEPAATTGGPARPTEILLLGTPHFNQLYKAANLLTDVLTPRRQAELAQLRAQVLKFRPDAIMVEELPEQQTRLDSLYALYRQDKLDLNTLPGGRSETYQLGFVLGKTLGLSRITCVNSEGGTSQSILHEGTNIALYQQATTEHRAYASPMMQSWEKGELTMGGLLGFVNSPTMLNQLHTLVYRTPARVTDGTLKPDPMVDAAFIKPRYVGAEFISVFYNRDLKIYSSIVTSQLATGSARVLTIIGGRHVASLQHIFATDPAYRVVPATAYMKPK